MPALHVDKHDRFCRNHCHTTHPAHSSRRRPLGTHAPYGGASTTANQPCAELLCPNNMRCHCLMPLLCCLQAQSWIDAALVSGGAVLVHCHEGKSRSVTLLLAYLMIGRGLTLAEALGHMKRVHPKASPNAGMKEPGQAVVCWKCSVPLVQPQAVWTVVVGDVRSVHRHSV